MKAVATSSSEKNTYRADPCLYASSVYVHLLNSKCLFSQARYYGMMRSIALSAKSGGSTPLPLSYELP